VKLFVNLYVQSIYIYMLEFYVFLYVLKLKFDEIWEYSGTVPELFTEFNKAYD
jgi:hypothetical protein